MSKALSQPKEKAVPITADELRKRLRVRFPRNEYALLFEVRNGTGFERLPRSADAVVMSLWPSRGLQLIGFEIKVSRADWKKELESPEKSDAIGKYCDRWYLVVSDMAIVQPLELPSAWGLMVAHGDGLRVAQEAPAREVVPLDRLFFASLLRSVQRAPMEDPEVVEEFERRDAVAKLNVDSHTKWELEKFAELKDKVAKFEAASGVSMAGWRAGDEVGNAVRFVLDGGMAAAEKRLEKLKAAAQSVLETVDQAIATRPT